MVGIFSIIGIIKKERQFKNELWINKQLFLLSICNMELIKEPFMIPWEFICEFRYD
jgi:hypothetical protein